MTGHMDHDRRNLLNIDFPKAFFEDEVREGFFVTTMMKRYWAAQLKVLSVIAGICDRHGISWFADYGTLMGAVRHEGYIPWDDDLDICMLRSDWNRFFEAARNELPQGYVIMTLKEQEEYRELIGRISNSHAIDYSPAHLEEFYGCPYTVGVDIFPLDGLYDDPDLEEDRKKRAQRVLDAYGIVQAEGEDSQRLRTLLPVIERDNRVHLRPGAGLERKLVLLLDRIYSECPDEGAMKVALMRFYMSHGNHIYDRKMYESYVELPFENTFIRAMGRYDEKLRADYGDYMHVSRAGGVHGYPVYSEQEQILREHTGSNPYRYTLDNQELLASVGRYIMKATSPKAAKDRRSIAFFPCRAKWWNTMEGMWKRAVSDPALDVFVVPVPYYDRDFAGDIGDEYYEKELFPGYVNALDYRDYDPAKERPDIIVIQVPYDGWSTYMATPQEYYSKYLVNCTDELVYIPCFDPDDLDTDGGKAEVAIRILAEQPAVVNSDKVALKSERMRQVYIKRLIELTGEPTRDYWNQKILLESEFGWGTERPEDISGTAEGEYRPAYTVEAAEGEYRHAYTVEAAEGEYRQAYIGEPAEGDRKPEGISEYAGGNHIVVKDKVGLINGETADDEWTGLVGDVTGRKVVIYYVSISFLLQGRERAIDKIKKSLDIFAENADKIQTVLLPQEALITDLERIDSKLWEEFCGLTAEIGTRWKNCVYDMDGVAAGYVDKWDAFYGDPGTLPRKCVLKNKPVMIQNIDV